MVFPVTERFFLSVLDAARVRPGEPIRPPAAATFPSQGRQHMIHMSVRVL
jgi:hypothetical protein